MASTSTSTTTSEASAAAEEPGLNGDGHDQRVHVPTKGTSTGKGKLKAGTKKGKGKGTATTYCANCGEEGDARCTGCGVVYYCRKNIVIKNGKKVNLCQQVRHALEHTGRTRMRERMHALTHLTSRSAHRSTGSVAATRARALPTCSRARRRRSRIGCARRRSRRTGA